MALPSSFSNRLVEITTTTGGVRSLRDLYEQKASQSPSLGSSSLLSKPSTSAFSTASYTGNSSDSHNNNPNPNPNPGEPSTTPKSQFFPVADAATSLTSTLDSGPTSPSLLPSQEQQQPPPHEFPTMPSSPPGGLTGSDSTTPNDYRDNRQKHHPHMSPPSSTPPHHSAPVETGGRFGNFQVVYTSPESASSSCASSPSLPTHSPVTRRIPSDCSIGSIGDRMARLRVTSRDHSVEPCDGDDDDDGDNNHTLTEDSFKGSADNDTRPDPATPDHDDERNLNKSGLGSDTQSLTPSPTEPAISSTPSPRSLIQQHDKSVQPPVSTGPPSTFSRTGNRGAATPGTSNSRSSRRSSNSSKHSSSFGVSISSPTTPSSVLPSRSFLAPTQASVARVRLNGSTTTSPLPFQPTRSTQLNITPRRTRTTPLDRPSLNDPISVFTLQSSSSTCSPFSSSTSSRFRNGVSDKYSPSTPNSPRTFADRVLQRKMRSTTVSNGTTSAKTHQTSPAYRPVSSVGYHNTATANPPTNPAAAAGSSPSSQLHPDHQARIARLARPTASSSLREAANVAAKRGGVYTANGGSTAPVIGTSGVTYPGNNTLETPSKQMLKG